MVALREGHDELARVLDGAGEGDGGVAEDGGGDETVLVPQELRALEVEVAFGVGWWGWGSWGVWLGGGTSRGRVVED